MEIVGQIHFYGRYLDIYENLDDPLFLAVDVARMIDYSVGHTAHMLSCIGNKDKVLVNVSSRTINASGGRHNANKWFLTRDGLEEVLFQSRKPIARAFKHAVRKQLRELQKQKDMNIIEWYSYLDDQSDPLVAEWESLGGDEFMPWNDWLIEYKGFTKSMLYDD